MMTLGAGGGLKFEKNMSQVKFEFN